MGMKKHNTGFVCQNCGAEVAPQNVSERNHCPHCLYSLHVDLNVPGDRKSVCHGKMKPIAV